MKSPVSLFVVFAMAAQLAAQKAPVWTADEATMAALLPMLARGDAVPFVKKQMQGARLGDFVWQRLDTPASAGPGHVGYAWPTATSTRTFAIGDRLVPMFTEQRERPYGQGECIPAWHALIAKGGEATFAQLLDMPGRGTDDQIWQPVAVERTVRTTIAVRGDDGEPLTGVQVALAPASWFGDAPHAALGDGPGAVGVATVDPRGTVQFASVPVRGVCAGLALGGALVPVEPSVQHDAAGLVLVADRAAVSQFVIARRNANESAAIATLKNISSAQSQMQACGANDANGNGAGEYAFFAQLCGAATVQAPAAPGGEVKLSPPVLSTAFRTVHGSCVVRSGYLFQIYLPGKDGWLTEAPSGGAHGVAVDPKRAEVRWCVYAWPVEAGVTGQRVFYIDQAGDVTAARNELSRYSGRDQRPAANAAQTGTAEQPQAAANAVGADGNTWIVIS